jgi:hypothetical protein
VRAEHHRRAGRVVGRHWITSLARKRIDVGMSAPIAFAVLSLTGITVELGAPGADP